MRLLLCLRDIFVTCLDKRYPASKQDYMESNQSGRKKKIGTEWYEMSKQKVYLREASVSRPDKHIVVPNKILLKMRKGHDRILQSLALKYHKSSWVKTQIVLPRALARRGLSIPVAKANLSLINYKIT